MSTNVTLRNNFAKKGSNILCGNNINKEKEICQTLNDKKASGVVQGFAQNNLNSSVNLNSQNILLTNNKGKGSILNKLKFPKLKVKENNENDKNVNNIIYKKKLTIDLENCKKSNFNCNTNDNQNNISINKEVIISEISENIYENSVNNESFACDRNKTKESTTQRNPQRNSLHLIAEKNLTTKNNLLLRGEEKKNCTKTKANNISTNLANTNPDINKGLNNKTEISNNRIKNNRDNLDSCKETNLLNKEEVIQAKDSTISNNTNNCQNNKINFKSLINGISINNNLNNQVNSFNFENICISKNNAAKFTNEEYMRMFTRLIRKDLGNSFLNDLFLEEEQIEDFLENHKVTERMRSRMIDWMIEVLTNYRCNDHTFFIAINTMDRFFNASKSTSLQPSELHLIGVVAMFMASKYEDIYPLRLKLVHEKIAHQKLSCQEIKEKEIEISNKLEFIIGKPTQWDFINHFIEEIFFTQVNNFGVQDNNLNENYGGAMGCVSNTLLKAHSEKELEIFSKYTPNMINLLRYVVVYLSKMNCHDYILSCKKPSLIAASTIFVGMKICEQINKEEYMNEYLSKKLTEISKKNENDIIKTAHKILYNAQNFDSVFNGLENLKKVHFNAIIDLKNTK